MRAIRKLNDTSLGRCPVIALTFLLTSSLFLSVPIQAQESEIVTVTGTVNSVSKNTMVMKGEDGRYRLYTFEGNTTKPAMITLGSLVRVLSYPSGEAGYRIAYVVQVLREGPAPPPPAGTTPPEPDVVPLEIIHLENSIQRTARKFHLGVRGGFSLDPELVLIGVHAQFGPFFSQNLFFRPNVEFDWGEVTKMFAINAEMIYRLPITSRYSTWAVYFGGGPAFNFAEQSFGRNDISFSDFRYDAALNILMGVQYRSGVFMEVKSSIFADPAPAFRLLLGYNF